MRGHARQRRGSTLHVGPPCLSFVSVMRLLVWHCRNLSYTDRHPSNRPASEAPLTPKSSGRYSDVVAALLSIEEGDGSNEVHAAADELAQIARMWQRKDIVLVPFAHLSNRLMGRPQAMALLDSVYDALLACDDLRVEKTSFGWHKDFAMAVDSYGHRGSVAYREFPLGGVLGEHDEMTQTFKRP